MHFTKDSGWMAEHQDRQSCQRCISATWVIIFAARWLADLVEVKKEKMGSLEVGAVRDTVYCLKRFAFIKVHQYRAKWGLYHGLPRILFNWGRGGIKGVFIYVFSVSFLLLLACAR